jgi:hypothetical protein
MNKIIAMLVLGILILGGLGAAAGPDFERENDELETVFFSQPIIYERDDFVTIGLSEKTSDLWESNKPILPVVTKVYTYPLGTKIDSVDVTFSDVIEKDITKLIQPSPEPIMKSAIHTSSVNEVSKEVDYSNINIYPKYRFSYRTAGGLNDDEHVTYLSVNLYPIQYSPNDNKIYYSEKATIDIKYKPPSNPISFGEAYDLLIIAPADFETALIPLVDHKNSIGIQTKLSTLDEIPSGVGVDQQEDIKYFIKDAIETWGITYLILVGAGVEGNEIFPVRLAWIPSNPYEDNFPSDLYYADIYNDTGGFSSWDHDGDGRYGEYTADVPAMDVLPDVHLGKLPANNIAEVTTVVNKIINYKEHNKMMTKILQIGGDTFPGDGEGVYEGEFANEDVLAHLPGYSTTRLWASNGELTKGNIAKGLNNGVDFVDFSGHGSVHTWATHPCDDDSVWIPAKTLFSPYTGWLYTDFEIFFVRNSKKLPVFFYNACSNNKYTKSETCLSWKTLIYQNGGGIAAFGASGIGYGSPGSHETERLMGWMEVHIFEEIFLNKILGHAWSNCITNYYNNFSSSLNSGDYKTMLEISMFADPTLAIEDGDDPVVRSKYMSQFPILERLLELFPRFADLIEKLTS